MKEGLLISFIDKTIIEDVLTDGFGIVRGVLSGQKVAGLVEELERFLLEDNSIGGNVSGTGSNMVSNPMLRGEKNACLIENEVMHAYLDVLMSPTCIIYANHSSSMPPFGTNYSNRIHVDCPRSIPGYITNLGVMFALSDFTRENGATWFLPGSQHLAQEEVTEDLFVASARRALCRSGDMILFNARIWHKGGENTTDRPRHSVALNICRSFMRQRFDYPRLIVNERSDILNWIGDRGMRMLGYSVRMPASYEDYFLPEAKRLYKANQG